MDMQLGLPNRFLIASLGRRQTDNKGALYVLYHTPVKQ